ncbi:DUF2057 family protein [Vibrio sagamiensis]|uniref:DUF2057 domain-containing protein n=1 Tax=Vibrio sagamiensis NBRC 104589 TaxID=1219064 RepID=A0A511QBQ4_9VIBR|nr:DUF2057 family protein [Vibrio sagamiensis]PNQ54066.1 DUF2057 domain-containing protein [Vibrio agarivorans]GEM74708.1 hypothetical protein VSA01S_08200 [Vibrio sagamiensis NBRC 104589]
MKFLYKTLLVTGLMTSFSSFATVNVDFDVAIEPMLINGEEVGSFVNQMTKAELPNGTNQLVIRVSKLIRDKGVFTKFKSEPIVLTFDASDTNLRIEPGKAFNSSEEVGDFQTNPKAKIIQNDGNIMSVHEGVLEPGKGLIRDYSDELAAYNMAHGHTFELSNEALTAALPEAGEKSKVELIKESKIKAEREKQLQPKKINISLRKTAKVESLKGQFKGLTVTEQKEFLAWAIMQ